MKAVCVKPDRSLEVRDVPTTVLFMTKNLVVKRFSNFESATVKDRKNLAAALADLQGRIDDPLFQTRIGKEFHFDEIDAAMRFEAGAGAKAVLVA